jgi:putative endonuclease
MPNANGGFVYILASKPNGTLYVGVTNDIVRRVHQHRKGEGSEFVEEYDVTRLVHLERFDDIEAAIRREKQLKAWKREWKLALIRDHNPTWRDLYEEACRTYGGNRAVTGESPAPS